MPLNPLTPLDACFLFMKSFRVLDVRYSENLIRNVRNAFSLLELGDTGKQSALCASFLLFEKKIVTELHEMDQKFSHCVEEYNLEFVVTNDKENHLIF